MDEVKKRRRGRGRAVTEFVGGNVRPEVRAALRQEAARRGLNVTKTLEAVILAHVGRPLPQSEAETAA